MPDVGGDVVWVAVSAPEVAPLAEVCHQVAQVSVGFVQPFGGGDADGGRLYCEEAECGVDVADVASEDAVVDCCGGGWSTEGEGVASCLAGGGGGGDAHGRTDGWVAGKIVFVLRRGWLGRAASDLL